MWRSLRTTNTKHDMIVLATPNRSRFEREREKTARGGRGVRGGARDHAVATWLDVEEKKRKSGRYGKEVERRRVVSGLWWR